MKEEIAPKLGPPLSGGGALEIIVRDYQRLDKYPDGDDTLSGISPWFKALLVGTYDGGVEVVGYPVRGIVADGVARRSEDEDAELLRRGCRIPYERIIQADGAAITTTRSHSSTARSDDASARISKGSHAPTGTVPTSTPTNAWTASPGIGNAGQLGRSTTIGSCIGKCSGIKPSSLSRFEQPGPTRPVGPADLRFL